MSETHEHELAEAAASGAAAAVAAVSDEIAEEERSDAVANAALSAGESADIAGAEAEQAAEAATAAAAVATEAHAQSSTAEATAEEAATEAAQARMGVEDLHEKVMAGFSELREFITSKLTPEPPASEPTEVVVSHGNSGESAGERSDAGSGGSPEPADERPYRHRFGSRRR